MGKPNISLHNHLWFVTITAFSFFFLFLFLCVFEFSVFSAQSNAVSYLNSFANPLMANSSDVHGNSVSDFDSCLGKYIYIHDLPSRFNEDLLRNCSPLMKGFYMCPYLNFGLGAKVSADHEGVLSKNSWFASNQFSLSVIFHSRMKNYKCLTKNSSMASAIFVPFYAGMDSGRQLFGNTTVRDSLVLDLVKWLRRQNEWKTLLGRDHFLVSGRVGWDFRRSTENENDYGNKLMMLPESMNLTLLSIESTSWSNEFAIPYPTYFHPESDNQVIEWQNRMRKRDRKYLFSFAGGPRHFKDSIRQELVSQCLDSTNCKLLNCSSGGICDDPVEVIRVFRDSVFCLQPPGDTYTRRSTFDSILAGCIPVFFHPGSAYAQYTWHLPRNYSKYSVFIPWNLMKEGRVWINQTLLQVSKQEVLEMQEEVIRLIPKVIYADPRGKLERIEDAFDLAVKGILERVEKVRRESKEGKDPGVGFAENNSWKVKVLGTGKEDEWLQYFKGPYDVASILKSLKLNLYKII